MDTTRADIPSSGARPVHQGAALLSPDDVTTHLAEQLASHEATAQADLVRRARAFVDDLFALQVGSPAFGRKAETIAVLGVKRTRAAQAAIEHLLDRSPHARGPEGDVHGAIAALRGVAARLDPARVDFSPRRSLRSRLSGLIGVDTYFARYVAAQGDLDDIVRALQAGQDAARKRSAAIEVDRRRASEALDALGDLQRELAALDAEVVDRLSHLDASGAAVSADAVRSSVLEPVRRRQQDVMTQVAVALQARLALEVVRANDRELVRGAETARATTLAVLESAVTATRALGLQTLVLDRLTTVRSAVLGVGASVGSAGAGAGPVAPSSAGSGRSEAVGQAASTGSTPAGEPSVPEVDALRAAFGRLVTDMDRLDAFTSQAQAAAARSHEQVLAQDERRRRAASAA
ncbi:toxic anion resistance protein [Oerskovia jenensis]|uniref:Uncharacterized protein YaaN involved in tellurite resistance n=1 Tax=Oerskovia jenensis TaxID=162169 RepID=A0ABS2LF79_9CELL|nr:toxic anion resistance protein [Oerskovia jenensis]MBM7479081.1 uncharacterized protein YaaN involved in tellurite resistance [Oerskovia jenensis]